MIDGFEHNYTSPIINEDSTEENNFFMLSDLSFERAYIPHTNEDIPFRNKNQMVTTPMEDSKEQCFTQLKKNIEVTTNLVTLVRRGRTSNFRLKNNVAVLKPLKIIKSHPSRLLFLPNELGLEETLTVYVRSRSHFTSEPGGFIPCTTSPNKCGCFESHSDAVFCVTAGWDPRNVVSWNTSPGGNPRAEILIKNLEFLRIEFASLYLHSAMFHPRISQFVFQELVFRLKKADIIFEQTYFIKCSASPGRDIKPFLQQLYQKGLISQEAIRKTSKQKSSHPSIYPHRFFPHFIRITSLSAEERKNLEEANVQILNNYVSKPH